ncbi:MAG: Gfo/Idh/MocA family oxidoreductase [Armatimonadetes bacterium]|nr:Gfo/Idh/MocA family oxidoreductase [Armatimonadota bacterium]
MKPIVKIGVIGGGLMGRETASALARWFVLLDRPVDVSLTAVADTDPGALDWFRQVPGVSLLTADYRELLASPDVDVVYAAVPHDLHEEVYTATVAAGKDLLAEKPFGIDLAAAQRISDSVRSSGRFVRVSSEFPFFPGAQAVFEHLRRDDIGDLLEVQSVFLHSSDLDLKKPVNWKRKAATCGQAGVMNDLGLHVVHLPFRLGFHPVSVYAQLQNVVTTRPDGRGGTADCDTWDNATLHTTLANGAPMRLETKRLAPGETNTWRVEVLGSRCGVRFSTKEPKTLWSYRDGGSQGWIRQDVGHKPSYPVVTGGIFEFGFPDALLQMLAAYLAEREGRLDGRFGCATVDEAVMSHRLWAAALSSHSSHRAVDF